MLKKNKLEEDYQNFIKNIERMAAEEIKKIRERANALKEEAANIGEAVELSLNEKETETVTKKVNT
ncbi:MAG TPA: hypothetical protein VK253_00305 [Candidatus Binatia bacterium]|nr:hypothetical protein [Candidatus Binatia bacterium]